MYYSVRHFNTPFLFVVCFYFFPFKYKNKSKLNLTFRKLKQNCYPLWHACKQQAPQGAAKGRAGSHGKYTCLHARPQSAHWRVSNHFADSWRCRECISVCTTSQARSCWHKQVNNSSVCMCKGD